MRALHAGPTAQGLYDPRFEHDACGVAFVATLTGDPSHIIVEQALTALRNLDHRGAAGAEANSGDGAGILLQVPDAFLREVVDFTLPPQGAYAVGTAFLDGDAGQVVKTKARVEELADEEGLAVVGWRDVPVDASALGATARGVMPVFSQLFVQAKGVRITGMALERMAFCLRKRAEHETDVYFASLSSRTLVYKGMLTTEQLDTFYPDLVDERVASAPGRRPLPVLDEHLPELAAGPPLPVHRPQRRDQHGDGQPQLDAGPRGPAAQRPDPRRPRPAVPHLHAGRVRLGELRRGAGAAPHGRAQPAPRGADDDPGGLGEAPGDGHRAAGPSTSSTPP